MLDTSYTPLGDLDQISHLSVIRQVKPCTNSESLPAKDQSNCLPDHLVENTVAAVVFQKGLPSPLALSEREIVAVACR